MACLASPCPPQRPIRGKPSAPGARSHRKARFRWRRGGRLQSLTNNLPASTWNNQWSFGYNPAGQIVSSARTNDLFAFSAVYNVDRGYTANGLNQYTAAGATGFGYDANGNLTGDGTNTFTYDIENRLVAVSGGRSAALRYDPLGRLYEVSGTATTRDYGDTLLNPDYGETLLNPQALPSLTVERGHAIAFPRWTEATKRVMDRTVIVVSQSKWNKK